MAEELPLISRTRHGSLPPLPNAPIPLVEPLLDEPILDVEPRPAIREVLTPASPEQSPRVSPEPSLFTMFNASEVDNGNALMVGEEKADEGRMSVGSEDSTEPSPHRLFEAVKAGDVDMLQKLLLSGTPWACETPTVRGCRRSSEMCPFAHNRFRYGVCRIRQSHCTSQ